MNDQSKLKEYLLVNRVFGSSTIREVTLVDAQRIFAFILGIRYLHNELVKVIFETTGIARVPVLRNEASNEMTRVWFLDDDFVINQKMNDE